MGADIRPGRDGTELFSLLNSRPSIMRGPSQTFSNVIRTLGPTHGAFMTPQLHSYFQPDGIPAFVTP